jgi:hypothetical protein
MRRWVSRWDFVPIQTNSRDLDLFDINQERVARKTTANSGVKKCDACENDYECCAYNPRSFATGEVAESQSKKSAGNKDYSTRDPILVTDFVEDPGSAFQPSDLFFQLQQTSHTRVNITR